MGHYISGLDLPCLVRDRSAQKILQNIFFLFFFFIFNYIINIYLFFFSSIKKKYFPPLFSFFLSSFFTVYQYYFISISSKFWVNPWRQEASSRRSTFTTNSRRRRRPFPSSFRGYGEPLGGGGMVASSAATAGLPKRTCPITDLSSLKTWQWLASIPITASVSRYAASIFCLLLSTPINAY